MVTFFDATPSRIPGAAGRQRPTGGRPAASIPAPGARPVDARAAQGFRPLRRPLPTWIALAFIASAAPASAAVLPVTSCADDGSPGTLRSVVATAASGDTVDLAMLGCTAITLTGGDIEVAADDLAIAGPGRHALTIDAAGASRVFLHRGIGTLDVRAVTISGGRVVGSHGGCISAENGSVRLVDARVTGCTAEGSLDQAFYPWGGAIFAVGDITLERSTAEDNLVTSDNASRLLGGALATWRVGEDFGDIMLIDSVVSGNRVVSNDTATGDAEGGGVATASSGTVTVLRSTLRDNSVQSASNDPYFTSLTAGGAISAFDLRIEQGTISGNSVVSVDARFNTGGGGIVVTGAADIIDSTIDNNQCNVTGGGLMHNGAIQGVSRLDIVNSTFANNHAGVAFGAIMVGAATTIHNSTIAFNSAPGAPPLHAAHPAGPPPPFDPPSGVGGVWFSPLDPTGTLQIESSIIAANAVDGNSPNGDDLAAPEFEPIDVAGSHNLIGDTTNMILPGDTLVGDPHLSPLADNGGPTQTLALATASPAIDAGSNTDGLVHDQRGAWFVRTSGGATDIGAFEDQPPPDVIFIGNFDG